MWKWTGTKQRQKECIKQSEWLSRRQGMGRSGEFIDDKRGRNKMKRMYDGQKEIWASLPQGLNEIDTQENIQGQGDIEESVAREEKERDFERQHV